MFLNEIPKYINLETRSLIESALEEGLAGTKQGQRA